MIVTVAGSTFSFLPNDAELGAVNVELAAFDGEVGSGQFPLPDPAVALTGTTGRQLKVVEDFALLSDGFILDQQRLRGPFLVGSQREFGFSMDDANALLHGFRVVRSRSSETDYARVIAFAALDGPTWDTTWVLNASTVTMPAKAYSDDGGWTELITDLVEFTGKTLFLHDKAGGGRCLHYHLLTNGHTCGLSISDAHIQGQPSTGDFVYTPQSPTRNLTSVDLANDVMGQDQSGRVSSATDATSIAAHDADGLQHQALVNFEAGSQADLDAKVAAYLASNKDDYATYSCSIGPLDGTALGMIWVGDLVTVTSAVMGLSASTQRISHMRLKVAGTVPAPGYWTAELELGAPIRRRSRIKPTVKQVVIAPDTPGSGNECCPPWDGIGSPSSGQDVINELDFTGDGSTTTFTTAFPYIAGSLAVWVAGLNVTSHKTETTPSTGAWALDFAPTTGQTVRVNYTAA